MRLCVCGNEIGSDPGFRVTYSPCRCDAPGPYRTTLGRESILDDITATQYAERKRTGLPLVTDSERSVLKEIR